jgi:hypothetical protein
MTSPTDEELIAAVIGIDDDFMTSETHHPGYVLIPTAKFEAIRTALCDRLEGRGGGEVVAWRWRSDDGGVWFTTCLPEAADALRKGGAEVQPLYASREGEGWREAEGWKLVPTKALPAMLERAAFNLCAEYGVEFVKPLGKFVEDAYEELVSAAPAPPSQGGE